MARTAERSDRLHAKWCTWLRKIQDDLTRAHFHQSIWSEFSAELGQRFPGADATLLVSYSQVYAHAQLVTIRRLTDNRSDVASLVRLIRDVVAHPEVLDRARFVAVARANGADVTDAEREFDSYLALGPGSDVIATQPWKDRLKALADKVGPIKVRVDKTIAHTDDAVLRRLRAGGTPLTPVLYADIRDALAYLGNVANDCSYALQYSRMGEWTPWLGGDWHEPFRPSLFGAP